MSSSTDRIEKQVLLRAPRSRVWRALTDAREFGTWFGVSLDSEFAPARRVTGRITHPGYEHLMLELTVERMHAEEYFSFRWHPAAIDPKANYSTEPTTLVEFRLADADEGTLLTVVESGFDLIPSGRRAEAFRMNSQGWAMQVENLRKHVAG
jgi:uncharacterized protein YndB with AHSA1/START domain